MFWGELKCCIDSLLGSGAAGGTRDADPEASESINERMSMFAIQRQR